MSSSYPPFCQGLRAASQQVPEVSEEIPLFTDVFFGSSCQCVACKCFSQAVSFENQSHPAASSNLRLNFIIILTLVDCGKHWEQAHTSAWGETTGPMNPSVLTNTAPNISVFSIKETLPER